MGTGALCALTSSLFVLLTVVRPVMAQGGELRGRVTDSEGRILTGAHVALKEPTRSAFSNVHGRFRFRDIPPASYTVEITLVGYRRLLQEVHVVPDDSTEHSFVLTPIVFSLPGIDVTAAQGPGGTSGDINGMTPMQPRDVQAKAGSAEDLLRSLQTYPGVTSPNDFTSQMIVRGSEPDQNLIVMDGVEVMNPYRLYGIVSMFNPYTVDRMTLMTGGFPARYSDRLSAVLEVDNRDGSRSYGPFRGMVNLSLTNINFVGEGAFYLETHEDDSTSSDLYYEEDDPPWNGSWLMATRRTYYDLIANPIVRSSGLAQGTVVLPNFQDFQFRLSLQPHYKHKFIISGATNRDQADLTGAQATGTVEEVTVKDLTFNDLVGIQWIWTHSPSTVGRYTLSFYQNGGSNSYAGLQDAASSFGLDLSSEEVTRLNDSLRAAGIDPLELLRSSGSYNFLFRKFAFNGHLSWAASREHTFQGGISLDYLLTDIGLGIDFDPRILAIRESNFRFSTLPEDFSSELRAHKAAVYIQDAFSVTEDLLLQGGLRLDNFGIMNRWYLAPRVSARYRWGSATSASIQWGMYFQSPGYEKTFLPGYEVYLTSTLYDLTGDRARSLRAEQSATTALSFETMVSSEWQIRIEAYRKQFTDLIVPRITTGTFYRTDPIPGKNPRLLEGWTEPYAVVEDSLTTVPENGATGHAYGGEVVLQKLVSDDPYSLYGWISYGYSVSNRDRQGFEYPFDFDRRHTVNVVLGWRLSPLLECGISFTYGSGFPNNPPVGARPRVYLAVDSVTGQRTPRIDSDVLGVIFDADRGGLKNLNSGRYPDYHRLDIRATFHTQWWGLHWSVYLDIMNVYHHKNVALVGYYVDRETLTMGTVETVMLPFLPSIGCTVIF